MSVSVAELIEKLKTMPQDEAVILWDGDFGGYEDIVSVIQIEDGRVAIL